MSMIDISSCVEKWASTTYTQTRGQVPNNVRYEISWNRVQCTGKIQRKITKNKKSQLPIYSGSYSNSTNTKSVHKITFDGETEATYTVNFAAGQTKGLPLPVNIALPDEVRNATDIFGHSVQLNTNWSSSDETKKFRWTMDSVVPNHSYSILEAKVYVTEQAITGTFEGKASLSGIIVVSLYNQHDNKILGVLEGDIKDIVDYAGEKRLTKEKKCLVWTLKGTFNFVFGINHHVQLSEDCNTLMFQRYQQLQRFQPEVQESNCNIL